MPDTLAERVIMTIFAIMLAMRMMHLAWKMVAGFAVHSEHVFPDPT